MPSSAVRSNMSSSRAAPSSMEYSVCTCRWTKPSLLAELPDIRRDQPFPELCGGHPSSAQAMWCSGGLVVRGRRSAYVSMAGPSDTTRRVSGGCGSPAGLPRGDALLDHRVHHPRDPFRTELGDVLGHPRDD